MKEPLFLVLLICILTACEKEVHIPIEYTEPKLVVNGLFNTDSLWEVEISASQYIYDSGTIPLINDAAVTITNSTGNTITLLNQGDGLYNSATEKPQTGQVYSINISHANYENASSSNQLPGELQVSNIELQDQTMVSGEQFRKISITFQDSPDPDFYMIRIVGGFWVETYDSLGMPDSSLIPYPMWVFSQSPAVENSNPNNMQPTIIFKDELFNSTQYTIDLLVEEYVFGGEKENIKDIYISISKISEEYYWYEKSYLAYVSSQNNQFFSQPVQVYTNIENGLGIFAGFSTQTDTINIP